ncbi:4-alpha-glucanotransferase [Bordetella sp. 15P40C-2]|uniref:4-alpha-glucanotransferase n=1 Tax=Bordetella sp. 15P40C-2 TaxID=2572246 RepID=UPI001328F935|nr:4-alpha-glucanotransferase [Bordetella sp. 15P40C-2]MVW73206.1 4-alpha-glucanotransferase [Bordetella sp. 15P40C-2]
MTTRARDLSALAQRAGLQEHWIDAHKTTQRMEAASLRVLLKALGLPADNDDDVAASHAALDAEARAQDPLQVQRAGSVAVLSGWREGAAELIAEDGGEMYAVTLESHEGGACLRLSAPPGYYTLRQAGREPQRLAITPRAPDMAALLGRDAPRSWGLMAQVYSLRRCDPDPVRGTWGYGDLGTVAELSQRLGAAGADVLALNPLHAMFSAQPGSCSPYSPSNRFFLNVLYAAPAMVLGEAAVRQSLSAMPQTDLATLDRASVIDWPRAAATRMQVMRELHSRFGEMDAKHQRDYRAYCERHGQRLRDHAVFEALHGSQGDPSTLWTGWQTGWQNPRSPSVREFARQHAREIDFHCFAQWLTAASLARAQAAAIDSGMCIGLLSDLAVGVSPGGSQVWSDPESFLQGVSVGAPPDLYQPRGQSWGLAALSPRALQQRGYEPFIGVLRAALAQTGGTRIDHILGMERLWLVPEGGTPAEGAYLNLPGEALMGLIALEAWRHRGLVIGENLGTVPPGFDERMAEHGIAGMNVLWFMREPTSTRPVFLGTEDWPVEAAALTTTHDLPTLSGWWKGTDILQREQAGRLRDDESAASLLQERQSEKQALWDTMQEETALPDDAPAEALLAFVASTPCELVLAGMEDIAGIDEAPNVPGTVTEFPNWQRRLPGDTLAQFDSAEWQSRLEALRRGRRTL